MLLGISIVSVNDAAMVNLLGVGAAAMFGPLLVMIVGGFAYDIQRQINLNKAEIDFLA